MLGLPCFAQTNVGYVTEGHTNFNQNFLQPYKASRCRKCVTTSTSYKNTLPCKYLTVMGLVMKMPKVLILFYQCLIQFIFIQSSIQFK